MSKFVNSLLWGVGIVGGIVAFFYITYLLDPPEPNSRVADLVSVIDGDTLYIEVDRRIEKIRLIGIDTPEVGECYYQEAKEALINIFPNSVVIYQFDISAIDKYDRWLVYLYTANNIPVNEYLVSMGFADVMTIPPNTKNADRYIQLRDQAKEDKLGMWGSCAY